MSPLAAERSPRDHGTSPFPRLWKGSLSGTSQRYFRSTVSVDPGIGGCPSGSERLNLEFGRAAERSPIHLSGVHLALTPASAAEEHRSDLYRKRFTVLK